ncbi:MAG: NAAT family transporter [Longimicrobiales bacterium]|nr:NAAT family transporter [Longimicrobiales bacterium]
MSQFLVLFVSIFSIVNPLAAIPIYAGMTEGLPADERRSLPRSAALAATVIMMAAYVAGESLLSFFSISIASLRVAGGVLIFGMAWSMLQARMSPQKHRPEESEDAAQRTHIAVVPLAMPLLAGPGTISVMILAATRTDGVVDHALALLAAAAVGLSIRVILGLAGPIAGFLGTTGVNVATRFMGLILAALAVEFMAAGLTEIFPAWSVAALPGGGTGGGGG